MYFSRIQLNQARRGAQKLLASRQAMHAAVLSSFRDENLSDVGRVLWRLDAGPQRRLDLYVVSPERPDFSSLEEQAGWPTTPVGWDIAPYGPFLTRLAAGQTYRFRLLANTTVSTKAGVSPGDRGRVVPVGSRAKQEEWFLDRCSGIGIEIPFSAGDVKGADGKVVAHRNLSLTARDTDAFVRRSDGRLRTVTLARGRFEGVLTVVDPTLLRAALCRGVGRGKAYGCGLLTLAPG